MRRALRRLLFAAAIGFLGQTYLSPAQAADVPSEPVAFTDYVSRAIAKAIPGGKVATSAPLYLSVDSPDGGKSSAYLQTLYSQCQRVPDRCDNFIATWVGQMSTSFSKQEAPLDRSTLRIVVRPTTYVDQLRQSQKEEPIAAPFIGELWMICVYDMPKTIGFPKGSQIEALGLSRDGALALCKENTAKALRPITDTAQLFPPGKLGLTADSPYESSRLLLPESWVPLMSEGGKLIVSAPGSDVMLFALSSSAQTVKALTTRTREVAQQVTRPISLAVFRWTPKGFEEMPP